MFLGANKLVFKADVYYSKIRKYVHISMNNKPYTITAGEVS